MMRRPGPHRAQVLPRSGRYEAKSFRASDEGMDSGPTVQGVRDGESPRVLMVGEQQGECDCAVP